MRGPEFRGFLSTKSDVQKKKICFYDNSKIFRQASELSAHILGLSNSGSLSC